MIFLHSFITQICLHPHLLPSRAIQTFLSIPSFRCTPTLRSFNSLLNALLTCRRFQTITHFASRLSEFGPPNPCTYNILIRSCFLQGRTDRALQLFDEMRRTNVRPDKVTFGTLIHGLCKDSRSPTTMDTLLHLLLLRRLRLQLARLKQMAMETLLLEQRSWCFLGMQQGLLIWKIC